MRKVPGQSTFYTRSSLRGRQPREPGEDHVLLPPLDFGRERRQEDKVRPQKYVYSRPRGVCGVSLSSSKVTPTQFCLSTPCLRSRAEQTRQVLQTKARDKWQMRISGTFRGGCKVLEAQRLRASNERRFCSSLMLVVSPRWMEATSRDVATEEGWERVSRLSLDPPSGTSLRATEPRVLRGGYRKLWRRPA